MENPGMEVRKAKANCSGPHPKGLQGAEATWFRTLPCADRSAAPICSETQDLNRYDEKCEETVSSRIRNSTDGAHIALFADGCQAAFTNIVMKLPE